MEAATTDEPSVRTRIVVAAAAGDWEGVLVAAQELGDARDIGGLVDRAVDAASASQLSRIVSLLKEGRYPGDRVAFRLALLQEHTGHLGAAVRTYGRVHGPLASEARRRADALVARAKLSPGRVAVLLPLSGPYASIGRELRVAIEIGAEAAPGIDLSFYDTGGDRDTAVQRVEEAVASGALAILGPVGDMESRSAAARAAQLGIPIALLGPGATDPATGIFRLVSSPEWEARAAAKLARQMGFKTVAVLAPRDEHGELAATAFARVATGLGIRVVADGRYDPTATELEPDLRAFFGLDPKKNARLRRHLRRYGKKGWKSFSPDVDYELLFIPDQYRRASLVASYLPYFSIEVRTRDLMNSYALRRKHGGRLPSVVQLMGPSAWHHPGLIPAGGAAIEGALVLDSFVGGPGEDFAYEEAASFASSYRRRGAVPAGPAAAQAHDAFLLVAAAVRAAGAGPTRAGVTKSLVRARIATGACGPARVGPSREVERELVVLRVESGEFVIHDY